MKDEIYQYFKRFHDYASKQMQKDIKKLNNLIWITKNIIQPFIKKQYGFIPMKHTKDDGLINYYSTLGLVINGNMIPDIDSIIDGLQ